MVEINKTRWMTTAEALFSREYDDPKEFNKTFTEPTDVYHELAKRVSEEVEDDGMTAYRTMYEAYAADQSNNNQSKLDGLVIQFLLNEYDKQGE